MFRNRGGERDLDHIINAALWGVERALLEYPQVRAGLILMMDRRLTPAENAIIVKKAIKYKEKGVVGIDLAGPDRRSFSMKRLAPLFRQAQDAGLGVTVHCGETGNLDEMRYVVREIKPSRIGHGIAAANDGKLMDELVKAGITLELCPTSNLKNRMLRDHRALKRVVACARRARRSNHGEHRRPGAVSHQCLQGTRIPDRHRCDVERRHRPLQPLGI